MAEETGIPYTRSTLNPWIFLPNEIMGAINWTICGEESGRNHRPMEKFWAVNLRDQCADAGTAFFMKQFTDRKGKSIPFEEFPAGLHTRQFPACFGSATMGLVG